MTAVKDEANSQKEKENNKVMIINQESITFSIYSNIRKVHIKKNNKIKRHTKNDSKILI